MWLIGGILVGVWVVRLLFGMTDASRTVYSIIIENEDGGYYSTWQLQRSGNLAVKTRKEGVTSE